MTFDDRKQEFESRYAHDQELRFRVEARRNKLLGLWAAEKLGRSGAEADAYAMEVVKADLQKEGDEDVVAKIMADFTAAGVAQSEHQLRRRMSELLIEAESQVKSA
ncbi:hypothetical protein SAMN02745911_0499 [Aureimonas altamirensis DSM 21988]|jgi:hypothetical protein|uniref:DUF1476 domain-containing protein n=1 Tax=Aureimonas altamirensis DSM 21988 TaxID=1121026 RepID=A0ABY1I3I9_9HYPH|nr:DUF1476 domain-containing protein [Aureimonas altamirensis]SHI55533.1 hypothetical protein SAMN02745911_0499 [Aureimonas altamirensis DSM 21988]